MPQKMLDVRPETFLQGVGQYSYEDTLPLLGLGWLGADESDILMGLQGLGRAGQRPSFMDSIVGNAREMQQKMDLVAKARIEAAKKNPVFAVALAKKKQQTSMPGANEARGVVLTLKQAADKAQKAKREEQAAKVLLAQSDKRGAAAKAVNAMTLAREAAILANKAEKTRLTRSLDILAKNLKSQVDFIEGVINRERKRSGESARTMALAATAQSLRDQIKKLQAQSATVAALPTVPPGAPTQQRIADLANKFNIRTAMESKQNAQKAIISVLSDLAENPMSQVPDYAGAVTYYGADGAGQIMADMEFGNYGKAVAGLRGMVHGVGYFESNALMADADATVKAAHAVARQTYDSVVLPAAGLSGLGALGDMVSDHGWCDRNNSNAKPGGFPASELEKCKKCPVTPPFTTANSYGYGRVFFTGKDECISPSPESPVGRQARGMTVDWGKVVQGWGTPSGGSATPPPPPPPPPPPQVPVQQGSAASTAGSGAYFPGVAAGTTGSGSNTMLYVGIGAGVLAIGGAAYYFLRKS